MKKHGVIMKKVICNEFRPGACSATCEHRKPHKKTDECTRLECIHPKKLFVPVKCVPKDNAEALFHLWLELPEESRKKVLSTIRAHFDRVLTSKKAYQTAYKILKSIK